MLPLEIYCAGQQDPMNKGETGLASGHLGQGGVTHLI